VSAPLTNIQKQVVSWMQKNGGHATRTGRNGHWQVDQHRTWPHSCMVALEKRGVARFTEHKPSRTGGEFPVKSALV